MISSQERKKLWIQYPEVWELFEEFNGIFLEDEQAWEKLVEKCHRIRGQYEKSKVVEILLSDAAYELEGIAKKRRYG